MVLIYGVVISSRRVLVSTPGVLASSRCVESLFWLSHNVTLPSHRVDSSCRLVESSSHSINS